MKLQTRKLCLEKLLKFCSLQLFHLMSFRALKSNLYLTRYNMRIKETKYEHMWLCSVVQGSPNRKPVGFLNRKNRTGIPVKPTGIPI
jgi:hypothetical protein